MFLLLMVVFWGFFCCTFVNMLSLTYSHFVCVFWILIHGVVCMDRISCKRISILGINKVESKYEHSLESDYTNTVSQLKMQGIYRNTVLLNVHGVCAKIPEMLRGSCNSSGHSH